MVVVRCCGEWNDGSCWTRFDRLRIFDLESAHINVKGAGFSSADVAPSLHCYRTFRFVCHFSLGFQTQVVRETQDEPGQADHGSKGDNAARDLREEGMRVIEATIKEEPGDTLGSHVWNSGVVLGMVLVARRLHSAAGHERLTVLDVGSGCGLASIVAAKLGYRVTATDRGSNMLGLLSSNIMANHVSGPMCSSSDHAGTCQAAVLDWLEPEALLDAGFCTQAGLKSRFTKPVRGRADNHVRDGSAAAAAASGEIEETVNPRVHSPAQNPCYDLIIAGDVLYCTDVGCLNLCCACWTPTAGPKQWYFWRILTETAAPFAQHLCCRKKDLRIHTRFLKWRYETRPGTGRPRASRSRPISRCS